MLRSAPRRADITRQRDAKVRKEALARITGDAAAVEAAVDAIYYHDMFHSAACWATDAQVTRELSSKTAQLKALKENFRMRSLGLRWAEFSTPWSKEGRDKSVAELAAELKAAIKSTSKRAVPPQPPVTAPARKELPKLGTLACDVKALDAQQGAAEAAVRAQAQKIRSAREAAGGRG